MNKIYPSIIQDQFTVIVSTMKIFSIAVFALNLLLVRAGGILEDIASSINKDVYKAVRTSVFTAQEVVGKPLEVKDLKFFYFNNFNRGQERILKPTDPKELANASGKIFFVIHGWFHTKKNNPWYSGVTNSLLSIYPDANVIQVDWEKGSTQEYSFAAFSTESVGKIIAELIQRMMTDYKVPVEKFVCIGHSLGGQMCGWVGKFVKKLTKKTLPRIVALDPAGPLFTLRPNSKRLNPKDAEVVQVIHSDGGKLGFLDPCGTIDFFPNGGNNQPGCSHIDLRNPLKLAEPVYCDHERAYYYFIEAIATPGSFPANKCSNKDDMESDNCHGNEVSLGDIETKEEGLYYLKTGSESPYSTGIVF